MSQIYRLCSHLSLTMAAAISSGLSPSRSNRKVTILLLCVCNWHSTTLSFWSETFRVKVSKGEEVKLYLHQVSPPLSTQVTVARLELERSKILPPKSRTENMTGGLLGRSDTVLLTLSG